MAQSLIGEPTNGENYIIMKPDVIKGITERRLMWTGRVRRKQGFLVSRVMEVTVNIRWQERYETDRIGNQSEGSCIG